MTTQLIIRIEPGLKEKVSKLAKSEGKNLSEVIRDLLENYAKERDMGAYIDDLWDQIGLRFSQQNIAESDIETAIKQVRSKNV